MPMNSTPERQSCSLTRVITIVTAAIAISAAMAAGMTSLEVTATGTCTNTRDALHPLLTDRLGEVEDTIRRLEELRSVLARSLDHVATCPDSTRPCQSECAFKALT